MEKKCVIHAILDSKRMKRLYDNRSGFARIHYLLLKNSSEFMAISLDLKVNCYYIK